MNAEPYFKKHFQWSRHDLSMRPVDYDSLIDDQEFLNILAVRSWAHKTMTAPAYARIDKKASELATILEAHLQELQ